MNRCISLPIFLWSRSFASSKSFKCSSNSSALLFCASSDKCISTLSRSSSSSNKPILPQAFLLSALSRTFSANSDDPTSILLVMSSVTCTAYLSSHSAASLPNAHSISASLSLSSIKSSCTATCSGLPTSG